MITLLTPFTNLLAPANGCQPTGILRVDWSSPFANGLCFCAVLKDGPQVTDLVSYTMTTAGAASVDTVTPVGAAVLFSNANAGKADFGTLNPITSPAYTIMAIANPAANGVNLQPTLFSQRLQGGSFVQIDMIANSDTSNAQASGKFSLFTIDTATTHYGAETDAAAVDGNYHVFVGRCTGAGAATTSVWVDGINRSLVNSGGTFNGNDTDVAQQTCISGLANAAVDTYAANCSVPLVVAWNRALSADEIRFLSGDPFNFLVPAEVELPVTFAPAQIPPPLGVLGIIGFGASEW